jgi:hypothetical protein
MMFNKKITASKTFLRFAGRFKDTGFDLLILGEKQKRSDLMGEPFPGPPPRIIKENV